MSFRILLISSMYDGNIETFYKKFQDVKDMPYLDHYTCLRDNSTEFCASYTRGFRMLGHETAFVSANDSVLQNKWISENNINDPSNVLFHQVNAFRPDILWIDNAGLVDKNWIKEIRAKSDFLRLVVGYHCSPYNQKIIDTLNSTDITLTCTPGLKEEFINHGIKTHLTYHAFDNTVPVTSQLHQPDEQLVFSGSLITGSRFHNERIRFIKFLLDNDIDISLYVNLESRKRIILKHLIYNSRRCLNTAGLKKIINMFPLFEHGIAKPEIYSKRLLARSKGPVYGQEMYDLFRKSKIILNMHVGVAGNSAGNMRMFEATGCGSCLLTDHKKNIRDIFEPDEEIVTYNNPAECAEKAKWLLENDSFRTKIAQAGHKRTMSDHTVLKRCEQIISIFENEMKIIIR